MDIICSGRVQKREELHRRWWSRLIIGPHMDPGNMNIERRRFALYGPLARYVKLRVVHAPGMPGTASPPPWVSDPGMHHGTCVTHVPWCIPGLLTSGFLWIRWRGKRSRHSRQCATSNFAYLVRGPWTGQVRFLLPPVKHRELHKSCL